MSVRGEAADGRCYCASSWWGLYPLRPCTCRFCLCSIVPDRCFLAALTQTKREATVGVFFHRDALHAVGLVALASVTYPAPAFFDGLKGILLYLLVYTFMNLGAFAVIASLRQSHVIGDELVRPCPDFISVPPLKRADADFPALLREFRPLSASMEYFRHFLSLIESVMYVLASAGVLYAVFGLYYYMRIANQMFIAAKHWTRLHSRSPGMRVAARGDRVLLLLHWNFPEHSFDGELVFGLRPGNASRRSDALATLVEVARHPRVLDPTCKTSEYGSTERSSPLSSHDDIPRS